MLLESLDPPTDVRDKSVFRATIGVPALTRHSGLTSKHLEERTMPLLRVSERWGIMNVRRRELPYGVARCTAETVRYDFHLDPFTSHKRERFVKRMRPRKRDRDQCFVVVGALVK